MQFKMFVKGILRTINKSTFNVSSIGYLAPPVTGKIPNVVGAEFTNNSSVFNSIEIIHNNPTTRLYGESTGFRLPPQDEGGRMEFPINVESPWFSAVVAGSYILFGADNLVSGISYYYYEDG